MPKYTKEELIALAERVLAQRDREKLRMKAYSIAVRRLTSIHGPEFKKLLEDAKAELGL